MNLPKIPERSYKTMKNIHTYHGRKEKFTAFIHCTKNLFLRRLLYYRQHGRCSKCGKVLTNYRLNTSVHHNTYDNYCRYPGPEIAIYCPCENGAFTKTVPNCELCYYKYPDVSELCLKNLCLLHSHCHSDLHKSNQ